MFKFLLFALGAALGTRPAHGQDILFTRSALIQPYQAPMASSPKGIYVSGAVYDPTGPSGPMASQSVLIKYDSSGTRLWSQQVAEPRGVFPQSIAADATAVYVAGATGFFVNYQAFVRKYDDAGKEVWFHQFPVGGSQVNQPGASVGSDASGVYVAASNAAYFYRLGDAGSEGILRKFSPAGDELWSRTVAMSLPLRVAVDETGLYLAGLNAGGGFVSRYTTDGDELWHHPLAGQSASVGTDVYVPRAMATDSTAIYIGGSVGYRLEEDGFEPAGPQGAFLLKLDRDGNELWTERFGGPSARVDALAMYDSGVYLAGSTPNSLPGQCRAGSYDPFVRKYDGAGTEQWTRQFGTPISENAGGIIADATGVYISGGAYAPNGSGTTFLTKIAKAPAAVDASRPHIQTECVLNSANYVGGGVSPGEIVTIYGGAMGPPALTTQLQQDGRIATFLGLTRIWFDGIAAPLLYVSATESSAVVPYEVSGKKTVSVEVEYQGVRSDPLVLPVFAVRLAAFTRDGSGSGQGTIRNEDGTLNSAENPAARGSIITMYLTGEGLSTPAVLDGTIAGSIPTQPLTRIQVEFEDPADPFGDAVLPAEIISAGGLSGAVAGLLELRFQVPATTRTGEAVAVHFWQAPQVDPVVYGLGAVTVALR